MRFILAWPVAWSLFWLGHLCSLFLDFSENERAVGVVYSAYNWLMIRSLLVSDWGEAGIWVKAE